MINVTHELLEEGLHVEGHGLHGLMHMSAVAAVGIRRQAIRQAHHFDQRLSSTVPLLALGLHEAGMVVLCVDESDEEAIGRSNSSAYYIGSNVDIKSS